MAVEIQEVQIVEEWIVEFWFKGTQGRTHEYRHDRRGDAIHAAKNLESIYDDVEVRVYKVTSRKVEIEREFVYGSEEVSDD